MHRLWFGEAPASFSLEVMGRLAFLYLLLVIAMRIMGRRMASQLTRTEVIAMVSLAAAVGPAVATPNQGLLPPIIVTIWVVCMQRWMALRSFRSHVFEHWMQGEAATLIAKGELQLRALRANGISRDALFAKLRGSGISHLGRMDRVYLEPNGAFTLIAARSERPGLSTIPGWDEGWRREQVTSPDFRACGRCGVLGEARQERAVCARCGALEWRPAVLR
jgi:uncharacterized membrane protein YcaP (DUF421 family)/ribosomal protein S27AE